MNRLLAAQKGGLITTAGAGLTSILTPAVGEAYEVIWAAGSHNEGAALWCQWHIGAPTATFLRALHDAVSLASMANLGLYGPSSANFTVLGSGRPIILRYGMSLQFTATGKTAGKEVYLAYLIDVYKGETIYDG